MRDEPDAGGRGGGQTVLVKDDASIAASCRYKLKASIEDHQLALCTIKEQLHTRLWPKEGQQTTMDVVHPPVVETANQLLKFPFPMS